MGVLCGTTESIVYLENHGCPAVLYTIPFLFSFSSLSVHTYMWRLPASPRAVVFRGLRSERIFIKKTLSSLKQNRAFIHEALSLPLSSFPVLRRRNMCLRYLDKSCVDYYRPGISRPCPFPPCVIQVNNQRGKPSPTPSLPFASLHLRPM